MIDTTTFNVLVATGFAGVLWLLMRRNRKR